MKTDDTLVNIGEPSETSVATVSVTTTAALPLSYIAVTRPCMLTLPLTGNGLGSVMACWPCTNSAGLNVPMLRIGEPPPQPTTTANVGNTCWSTPLVFSVVYASSPAPAPIPTAYSKASFDVHEASCASPALPTASGLSGIVRLPYWWC